MIINTIYDLCFQSVNWYLQFVLDDHHGNIFQIPSMKNRTLIIKEPEPNPNPPKNYGFLAISNCNIHTYVMGATAQPSHI